MDTKPQLSVQRRSTYPCECEYRACTRDGIEYVIRPIVPDDLERELAFVQSLSAESLYKRLMYAVRPTRDMLGPYVSVDYDHRMALVALDGASGQEHIIGVARYACDDDIAAHEFAMVIADDWQRRGIGTRLLERLFQYARAHGVRRLYGRVLRDNVAMLALARKLRLSKTDCPDDPGLVTVTLDLRHPQASRVDADDGSRSRRPAS